jgi:hypothetical protein
MATEMFADAAHDLAGTGMVRPSDRYGLALWAAATATATRALGELADHPDPASIEAKRLQVMAFQSMDKAARLASDFGLGPVARLRLGVGHLQSTSLLAIIDEWEAD